MSTITSQKSFCDRCGKEITNEINEVTYTENYQLKAMDLCPECKKDFLEFMENKQENVFANIDCKEIYKSLAKCTKEMQKLAGKSAFVYDKK